MSVIQSYLVILAAPEITIAAATTAAGEGGEEVEGGEGEIDACGRCGGGGGGCGEHIYENAVMKLWCYLENDSF